MRTGGIYDHLQWIGLAWTRRKHNAEAEAVRTGRIRSARGSGFDRFTLPHAAGDNRTPWSGSQVLARYLGARLSRLSGRPPLREIK